MRSWMIGMLAATSLAVSGAARCQQPAAPPAADMAHYDAGRETNVVGTVVAFTPNSTSAPFGARVTLQTSSGRLEIHLGDPRLLTANYFTMQSGDMLRIIGESLAFHGSRQFVARVIQKGTQALAARTARGTLIPYVTPRSDKPANPSQSVV